MFEKVNPMHPDKVADRIAGAIVDMAYSRTVNPRIAVEVLLGHGKCNVIIETSEMITAAVTQNIVKRIAGAMPTYTHVVAQDEHLSRNQYGAVRCGDNGIFRGVPVSDEQQRLTNIARDIYTECPSDGKYILDGGRLIACQSGLTLQHEGKLRADLTERYGIIDKTINPLGYWTGGLDVDSGATNRKLGSDMGDAVTGGGLHGKDLSKADVSVNVLCHIKAQQSQQRVEACTAIGDEEVTFRYENGKQETIPYEVVVNQAREYIKNTYHSFEGFAQWGLIRPL